MKKGLRKNNFTNSSQIELKAFYENERPRPIYEASIERPIVDGGKGLEGGESPPLPPLEFIPTQGEFKKPCTGAFVTMRQYAGFGSARESNKRYRMLLEKGTTGLSVAFDLPTQMGYDSDHIMSTGEVGKVGVAISSIEDMEILFGSDSLG